MFTDLIWIGNTLLPRGVVFGVFAAVIALMIFIVFVYITDERRS